MITRFFAKRKAITRRMQAIKALSDATRRKDTRSIHTARKKAIEATNECLRVGV